MIQTPNLQKAVESYIQEVMELYKSKIPVGTGDLYKSVSWRVTMNGDRYNVTLSLSDYWKYIEWDTKPHFPPIEPILKWVKAKNILPRETNGKLPTQPQLAFAIAKGISKHGTKGGHYLEKSIETVNSKYESIFDDALFKDLEALWDNV